MTSLAALFFLPLISFSFYTRLGHPRLPDMPLAQRLAARIDDADFSTLISRLEDHLQQDKNDSRGWMLLARSYRSAERFEDSIRAYREAVHLDKNNIPALLGLAEILSQMERRVTPEAKRIFQTVLQKEPRNPQARLFLAKAKIEKGDKRGGLFDLGVLLKEAIPGTPWHDLLQQEIKSNE